MYICVPTENTFNVKSGKIKILQQVKCKNKKINKRFSGSSKENILQFGKMVSYTEKFKIPKGKSKRFIYTKDSHLYKQKYTTLYEMLKELSFHFKIAKKYKNLTANIVSLNCYLEKNNVKVHVILENAYNNGYIKVGEVIDNGKLNVSFKNIPITNDLDKNLLTYIKNVSKNKTKIKGLDHEFYARFLNPKFIKKNLNMWYKLNKKFFDNFFRDLHKLHKMNIYHHDLHFDNIWIKGNRFKFIDFGRSINRNGALKINKNNSKLSKLRHTEKRKIKRLFKSNKLKAMMLTELNNQENINVGFEFARHDICEGILLNCFDRDNIPNFSEEYYKSILLVYKHFLAEKYKLVNSKR